MSGARIQTGPGRSFDLADPSPNDVHIEDIASALSKQCRFTGHLTAFYSVAQHSLLVADLCPPHRKLEGLLHDAHEAYCGDVSSPLKTLLPDYQRVEARVYRVIAVYFGMPDKMSPAVKVRDRQAVAIEARQLLAGGIIPELWEGYIDGLGLNYPKIVPMSPLEAEGAFLRRYNELQTLK